jgi:hypothetical protein
MDSKDRKSLHFGKFAKRHFADSGFENLQFSFPIHPDIAICNVGTLPAARGELGGF